MNLETADFNGHLEEYKKILKSNEFNIYYCIDCECEFAVSQNFEDQSCLKCPSCLDDKHLIDKEPGSMMKKGE